MKKLTRIGRRKSIIGAAVVTVLLVAVALVAIGNFRQHDSFEQTDQQLKTIQAQVGKIQAKQTNRQERLKIIDQLAKTSQTTNCGGQWWNAWQQQFGSLKQKADACRLTEQKIHQVVEVTGVLQAYLNDEQKITEQLLRLRIDSSRKDWPRLALKDAQAVADILGNMPVSKAAEPLLKISQRRSKSVVLAWQSLNSASGKQHKAEYLKAEAELKRAFADLVSIADTSDQQLSQLANELANSVE